MSDSMLRGIVGLPFTPGGRLRRSLRDAGRHQQQMLRALLLRGSHTVWGREHGFSEVLRYDDLVAAFQGRVGLSNYEDVREYVNRVREGESDVLWPGRTRQFGISGGTVSAGELIPVSPSMLRAMARSSLIPGLQYLSGRKGLSLLGGKILSIPGGVSEDRERPGVLVGEVSGLLARAAPRLLAWLFQAVPLDLMLHEEWDAKLQKIVARTVVQDIRAIVMVPSWAPMLFDALLAHAAVRGRRPQRVREVWPRLEVFFAGGVALRSYRPILERYLGRDIALIETYSASEGFFAFQDHLAASDMMLHVDSGVFYEFVRTEDLDRDMPRRFNVADIEPGVDYALYVTTCSGLWAYDVGDVVRFTQTLPPRLRVVGRTSAILDEYGEALFADEVAGALAEAASLTRALCLYHHVTYAPATESTLQHEWLVEFHVPPQDQRAFTTAADLYLQKNNRHYRIRREPGVLAPPTVTVLYPGTVMAYLRQTRKRLSAQTKLLPLSPNRAVAEGLKEVSAALVKR